MKNRTVKATVITFAVLCLLTSFSGCGNGYISKNDAMEVPMTDMSLQQMNVSNLTATLDDQKDPATYKVTFIYASKTYQYIVNAKTKAIISKGVISNQMS